MTANERRGPAPTVEEVKPEFAAPLQAEPGLGGGARIEEAKRATSTPPATSSASSSAPSSSLSTPASADLTGLSDVFFDFDQFTIRKDAQPALGGDARWLRADKGKNLLIEGHCDERGTFAYNLVLGEKRARAAKRYLEDLGIPASRMQITSYGKTRPFCREQNDACWQKNRRAHFVPQ